MGTILDQLEGKDPAPPVTVNPVRCRMCGRDNAPMQYCRHVRWTFDQGDPLEFTRFALETSPYTERRGFEVAHIPPAWWHENGGWVVEQVLLRFDVEDGYVFGDMGNLDLLARDVWNAFDPDA